MVRFNQKDSNLSRVLKDQSGMLSIVELMYVVLIFALVLGPIYNLLYFGEKNWARTSQDTEARNNARFAADRLVREIREAQTVSDSDYGIYQADDLELQFYADINNNPGPERIHYYINNNQLVKGVLNPSTSEEPWEYGGTEQTEIIAKYIRNTDSNPLFKYFDLEGNELTAIPLNVTDRKRIRRISVKLYVDTKLNELPEAMEIESEVGLRNLRD
jgi:hypothetical protein